MNHAVACLIVAAGTGERAGSGLAKQYRTLGLETVLARAVGPFLSHPAVSRVRVAIRQSDAETYRAALAPHPKLEAPIAGGATRQESVRLGLEALAADPPARVLIHDAARPFVDSDIISRVVAALDDGPAALPALPVADTVKSADAEGRVTATVARDGLWLAQTPQGFHFDAILSAHRKAAAAGENFTDDAAVAEWAGLDVRLVAGSAGNRKLTTAEDIAAAHGRLMGESAGALTETRVGFGYDVHPFGPGSGVVLGGIPIAHEGGLQGHSDADVGLHALTDALLGALADGDIGTHFPPSDAAWRGASSDRFLADAVARVAARGGRISHLDLTIVAEAPRIAPHRDAMRRRIAEICGLGIDRVSVKATTSEKLGFVGRAEGIAAHAVATIRLPLAGDAA